MNSPYRTLGVRDGAHPAEIVLAYEAIEKVKSQMDIEDQLEIENAYITLMSPSRRAEFEKKMELTVEKPYYIQPVMQPVVVQNSYNQESFLGQYKNNTLTSTILAACAGWGITIIVSFIVFLIGAL